MLLPEEVLLAIFEGLAYTSEPPATIHRARSRFRTVSPELLSLSFVNRQFRGLSLPFLFASLRIRRVRTAQRFLEFCSSNPSLCPEHTRGLLVELPFDRVLPLFECQLLCLIVAQLKRLDYADLGGFESNYAVLNAILNSSLTNLLIRSTTDSEFQQQFNNVLLKNPSKTVLQDIRFRDDLGYPIFSRTLGEWLDRGMKVERMSFGLERSSLLLNALRLRTVKGLKEIVLSIVYLTPSEPISFAWLPVLTAAQPQLEKIWLHDTARGTGNFFCKHLLCFVSSFATEIDRLDLHKYLCIRDIGLGKATGGFPSHQGWQVTELSIGISLQSPMLIEILSSVVSSFPAMEIFNLDLFDSKSPHLQPADSDLVSVLSRLPRLRYLYTQNLLQVLKDCRNLPTESASAKVAACAGTFVTWYTSLMAKKLVHLEAIHIREDGSARSQRGVYYSWNVAGWLYIDDGSRDVHGPLNCSGSNRR
ncbi:hypothetical protein D9757_003314 [Collybiopsis confluens]|uniref:Uncharacterized protein n=1 Tax=Collybiopsis confluens TaxID=2823264 RepID=A0A8H5MFI5_9AGAR|nr:hypothetical protein D9757_003314 [Collybiopsis confluens]